jgi:outer membrane protein OmpA-like peptidoglycan-associated protein
VYLLLGTICVFTIAVARPVIAEEKSAAQIIDALSPQLSRSLTGSAADQNAQDLRFIESIRSRTRSLTDPEREQVANVASSKPNLDIEVKFDYNSDAISRSAIPVVTTLGQALSDPKLKGVVFLVGGYTDAKGNDAYNLKLSQRRAEAVKRYLVNKFGLREEELVAVGFGKTKLKNPNEPYAAENRRVQIANMASH